MDEGRESRPARGAWIEISYFAFVTGNFRSRPARGAWIEIGITEDDGRGTGVAPRTGRVD